MTILNGTFNFYDSWHLEIGKGANLSSDTFKCLLTTSSYTPSSSGHSILSDITNEVSGNGYARQTLSTTWSIVAAAAKFTFTDPVFTASGGSIVGRYWVVFDDTVASPVKPLVAWGLIDSGNNDVTVTDGNTLTFNVNASGFFTVTG